MTEIAARCIRKQLRFQAIFQGNGEDEDRDRLESFQTGFAEENIDRLEKKIASYIGVPYAAAFNSGTAAIHMAIKLAAEKVYGNISGYNASNGYGRGGALSGKYVFCSDLTSSELVNPVVYEGGIPVFIDASADDWCMDPEVLEIAFETYQDVKIVLMNHVYGFPGQVREIKEICEKHGALLIEDASDSFGAKVDSRQVGSYGDYGILNFGNGRIITGTEGGVLLVKDHYSYQKAKNWATGSCAQAPWKQHDEIGYDYRMSDLIAGVICNQFRSLDECIGKKKAIYEGYQKRFDENLISMNPIGEGTEPNYWMPCMVCDSNIQFKETRSERQYTYTDQHGTASPMEVYDAFAAFGIWSSPVYKPMSMQPVFRNYDQITLDGSRRSYRDFFNDGFWVRCNVAKDCFDRSLCLPSNVGMTEKRQEQVVEIVHACFCGAGVGKWMFLEN